VEFDLAILQTLPSVARAAKWDLAICVWKAHTIVDVRPADDARPILRPCPRCGARPPLAAYLTDLQSGEVVATESGMNPQVAFGDDLSSAR